MKSFNRLRKLPLINEFRRQISDGSIEEKWDRHQFNIKLVNPSNKRKFHIIVVGAGLAGASASATLGELGYNVSCFCYQDSPRRAHSIAAQGGINAAKNYQNDGDSVYRLFYDTIKGGDFRSREANVYRLAQLSVNIIDQCVAQGVPFAREYGGLLANRSFGGAQVSRTFYARGQTGQQLLLGAYSTLNRQISLGQVKMYNRHEMLDLVIVNGHAKGIIVRNLTSGKIQRFAADAVILATGGYANVYYLSTGAAGCNVTAAYRAYRRGAGFFPILVLRKSIRPVIPNPVIIRANLHLCLNHFAMTGVCGFPKKRRIVTKIHVKYPRGIVIIILNASTQVLAILLLVIYPLDRRKKYVTKGAGWDPVDVGFISILPMLSSV